MFDDSKNQPPDIVADYWRAYFEWRAAYGLSDACMGELLAALRVEVNAPNIDPLQKTKLNALARMLEVELANEYNDRYAA